MKNKKPHFHKPAKLTGAEREGLLITTFGANADVLDEEGRIVRCHIRKNCDPVITGDRVYWLPEKEDTGIIVGHLPRKSLLYRPENAKKMKLIAANPDLILIVTAPPPLLSEDMIDCYLIAAELLKIQPVIVFNKTDLLDASQKNIMIEKLSVFKNLGYPVIFSSTVTHNGLDELARFLQDKTGVLVGASGVGKSSIIASLLPDIVIRTGETGASGHGKHTTTGTHLYHLPGGGNLIDSPGVREFGLWHIDQTDLLTGFIEFKPFLNQCKFRNCRHTSEPDCAIQKAITSKKIDARRYANYLKMTETLKPQNH